MKRWLIFCLLSFVTFAPDRGGTGGGLLEGRFILDFDQMGTYLREAEANPVDKLTDEESKAVSKILSGLSKEGPSGTALLFEFDPKGFRGQLARTEPKVGSVIRLNASLFYAKDGPLLTNEDVVVCLVEQLATHHGYPLNAWLKNLAKKIAKISERVSKEEKQNLKAFFDRAREIENRPYAVVSAAPFQGGPLDVVQGTFYPVRITGPYSKRFQIYFVEAHTQKPKLIVGTDKSALAFGNAAIEASQGQPFLGAISRLAKGQLTYDEEGIAIFTRTADGDAVLADVVSTYHKATSASYQGRLALHNDGRVILHATNNESYWVTFAIPALKAKVERYLKQFESPDNVTVYATPNSERPSTIQVISIFF